MYSDGDSELTYKTGQTLCLCHCIYRACLFTSSIIFFTTLKKINKWLILSNKSSQKTSELRQYMWNTLKTPLEQIRQLLFLMTLGSTIQAFIFLYSFCSFNCAVGSTPCNGSTSEKQIGKYVEDSNCGIMWGVIIQHLPRQNEEIKINSAWTDGGHTKIQIGNLPNAI
jgi:hypothetical protein